MSAGLLVARTSSRCAVEPGTHRVGSATSWVSPGNSRQAPRRRMSRQLIDRWRRRRGPRRRYSRTTVTPRCMSAISSTKRHPLWPLDVHHRHRLTGRHQTHQLVGSCRPEDEPRGWCTREIQPQGRLGAVVFWRLATCSDEKPSSAISNITVSATYVSVFKSLLNSIDVSFLALCCSDGLLFGSCKCSLSLSVQ